MSCLDGPGEGARAEAWYSRCAPEFEGGGGPGGLGCVNGKEVLDMSGTPDRSGSGLNKERLVRGGKCLCIRR